MTTTNTQPTETKTSTRAPLTRAEYEAAITKALHHPNPQLVDALISAHIEMLSEGLVDRTFGKFKKGLRKAEQDAAAKTVAK